MAYGIHIGSLGRVIYTLGVNDRGSHLCLGIIYASDTGTTDLRATLYYVYCEGVHRYVNYISIVQIVEGISASKLHGGASSLYSGGISLCNNSSGAGEARTPCV